MLTSSQPLLPSPAVFNLILITFRVVLTGFRQQARLQTEIIALRHQLTVLQRTPFRVNAQSENAPLDRRHAEHEEHVWDCSRISLRMAEECPALGPESTKAFWTFVPLFARTSSLPMDL